jgi:hypothetical protein
LEFVDICPRFYNLHNINSITADLFDGICDEWMKWGHLETMGAENEESENYQWSHIPPTCDSCKESQVSSFSFP